MGLRDELEAQRQKRGPKCRLSGIYQQLPDDEAEELHADIAGEEWGLREIARVLQNRGYQIDDQAIGRHRNRTCRTCFPTG